METNLTRVSNFCQLLCLAMAHTYYDDRFPGDIELAYENTIDLVKAKQAEGFDLGVAHTMTLGEFKDIAVKMLTEAAEIIEHE